MFDVHISMEGLWLFSNSLMLVAQILTSRSPVPEQTPAAFPYSRWALDHTRHTHSWREGCSVQLDWHPHTLYSDSLQVTKVPNCRQGK